MPKKSPSKPSASADSGQPASKSSSDCPPKGVKLVDLIEVVDQGALKQVDGAAATTTDKAIVSETVKRDDKDGANYKQYINLDPDVEGSDKRHPEYGRVVRLRARVEQKDGKTDELAGVKVVFTLKRTDGPNRKDAGGKEPKTWKDKDLPKNRRGGLGSAGGKTTKTESTDAKGWTGTVEVHLSEFAGDHFTVSAKLDASVEGAKGAPAKSMKANYVVWRKFWYQMTYAKGYSPPQPTAAEDAYAEVFAEMTLSKKKTFEKKDLPADLQDRTFMPAYQLAVGAGAGTDANVGDKSNIGEFSTNKKLTLDPSKDEPVKENLIVCEFQCDPKGPSTLKKYKLTKKDQTITIQVASGGKIISKPAIKASTKLVASGEWGTQKSPWSKKGKLTDEHIVIDSSRTSTLQVKIDLPKEAPTPTSAKPVWVRLKLETCKNYLGWATAGGIVAVYKPTAAKGASGSKVDFADTAAHEIGHKFNQTPTPGKHDPLNDHPLQYVGHGGSGPHCRHGASVAKGAVNWQDRTEKTPSPKDGDCVMYHRYTSKCSHVFCVVCKPYLQLEPMKSF